MGIVLALVAGGCGQVAPVYVRSTPVPAPPQRPRPADTFRYEPIHTTAPAAPLGAPAAPAPAPRSLSGTPAGWEPTVSPRPWRWIVVHHSGTRTGSAAAFDNWHRNGNHWDELGYHFVIGNGTGSGDGQIEIGGRWVKQKHGAHCRVGNDQTYNQTGIGICLVGDFEKTSPTPAQMASLAYLVEWLSARFAIADNHIIGHRAVDDTRCPGRYFPYADLSARVAARRDMRLRLAAARPR
jgi:hypothetical protein